jgi:hypothetical protein
MIQLSPESKLSGKAMPVKAMPAKAIRMSARTTKPGGVTTLLAGVSHLGTRHNRMSAKVLNTRVVAKRKTVTMMVIRQWRMMATREMRTKAMGISLDLG